MHNLAVTTLSVVAEDAPGTKTPILPAYGELIFSAIAFAILFLLIRKFVVPNLEKAYSERRAAIEGGMEQAQAAQKEAESAKHEYEAQLASARDEAAKIREDARAQGAQIVEESRAQAQAEASRIVEAGHRQTEAERQQAAASLKNDVGRMSTDLASKIVGESLHDETRQKGIVERFLQELESGSVKPTKIGSEAGN